MASRVVDFKRPRRSDDLDEVRHEGRLHDAIKVFTDSISVSLR